MVNEVSLLFSQPPFFFHSFRTRWAYGVSSQVDDKHILLFDVDNRELNAVVWLWKRYEGFRVASYDTEHGFHVIVFKPQSFIDTAKELLDFPWLDRVHFGFGLQRGYWFLETRVPIAWKKGELTYMRVKLAET